MTFYLKACPKCSGDMGEIQDRERQCYPCGFIIYPTPPLPFVWGGGSRKRAGVLQ